MTNIRIGRWDEGGVTELHLEQFLVSRAMITANSGGGKSYSVRRVIESLCGHVQQIIIDTEGEFSSLREKFDFVVCAAQGGDALAHPKTAALLCRRLMETKVSAVIDIQDLKHGDRQLFVKIFLETLMALPKTLWTPMVLHLDEAHIYCPEKGFGESIAADAVIDLATRGRKRGFCLVAATQRMAKFRKDCAAELLNKFIGRTGLDVDVKRAAFELGMTPKEAQAILPHLTYAFYAYGPAISKTVRPMKFDKVETSHPEAGVARTKELPKPTKAITAVLPQLADLPKEAEREAQTLKELQETIRQQDQALRAIERERAKGPTVIVDHGRMQDLKIVIGQKSARIKQLETSNRALLKLAREGHKWMHRHAADAQTFAEAVALSSTRYQAFMDPQLAKAESDQVVEPEPAPQKVEAPQRRHQFGDAIVKAEGEPYVDETFMPSKPQKEILDGLAWLADKGFEEPTREMLSAICKKRGGSYNNNLSALKTAGLILYPPGGGTVKMTQQGAQHALVVGHDGREIWEHWMEVLTNPQGDILKALVELGEPISRDDLSQRIGKSGGSYNNNLSAMVTMGALYYPQKGWVALTKNVVP